MYYLLEKKKEKKNVSDDSIYHKYTSKLLLNTTNHVLRERGAQRPRRPLTIYLSIYLYML